LSEDLQHLIDAVGEDNILFETDLPHATCLYPEPLEEVEEKMMTFRAETRRQILGDDSPFSTGSHSPVGARPSRLGGT
jgi:hypothetical protein